MLGRIWVYGSGHIRIGENVLLYPGVHLETQGKARIELGDDVVISRGAHLVAMAGVTVGKGTLIGEYTSIRDANHMRDPGQPIRDSGYNAKPIRIGDEVWIGRGVTILGGVTIGDKATVGANAVVTRDVPEGVTVVGIPASPISANRRPLDPLCSLSSSDSRAVQVGPGPGAFSAVPGARHVPLPLMPKCASCPPCVMVEVVDRVDKSQVVQQSAVQISLSKS